MNFFFKKAVTILALIFTVQLIAGCASNKPKSPPQAEAETSGKAAQPGRPEFAESRPRVTARDELTVACSKSEVELDFRKSYLASEAQLYTALYEGLFSYHPLTMEPIPAVAEDWELSDDKKEWTFTLRQNAKYWNGDPVTAEDFRAAWLSLLSPKADAPYSSLFDIIEGAKEYRTGAAGNAAHIGITAPDARTLKVKLNAPASFFPSMLCHHSFSPIHRSMLGRADWSVSPPVSNGPFRVTDIAEDKIILAKAVNYWDAERVSLNKIILKYTETGDDASSLWNSGEARWISGEVNIDSLTDRSGIQVNAMFATHYYYIRSGEKPWNDYGVRRALALALPWDEIRSNHFLPAKTLIFPLTGYPELEGLTETNIEEAAGLLDRKSVV
jgi:peptide/nickel transport system substrate-binding protein/oligopeptide transport system substrate-binding protein